MVLLDSVQCLAYNSSSMVWYGWTSVQSVAYNSSSMVWYGWTSQFLAYNSSYSTMLIPHLKSFGVKTVISSLVVTTSPFYQPNNLQDGNFIKLLTFRLQCCSLHQGVHT